MAPTAEDRTDGGLTHIDARGRARMVDVSAKAVTRRVAEARCTVHTVADVRGVLADPPGDGDLIEAARVAGVLAAKKTASLIPLCHPLLVDRVTVDLVPDDHRVRVVAVADITERTGVEMEALTACATAALVLVQAFLAVDPAASVDDLTLWHKSGGRSGTWQRTDGPDGGPASAAGGPASAASGLGTAASGSGRGRT
ncbi:MAG TPA: cyclic pyranopterin monophosphate synthase MoaC [Acidimicrobiales bacterium]|nr:cyclic pyranopterin monophosphate synthase MoaC [Acidimicrobiales bacterium]